MKGVDASMTKKLAKAILFQGNLERRPYFEGGITNRYLMMENKLLV